MIELKKALSILEKGDWCNIRVITANVNKGTGGQVLELAKCRIARNRNITTTSVAKAKRYGIPGTKDPNQRENFTRNVELPNHSIITVHPILFTHINNQPIL